MKSIDVLLPVHGPAPFLSETIRSLEFQSDNHFRVIFINDQAKVSALQIMNEACMRNSNFILVESIGTGIVNALNTGLDISKADYIARIDSDDLMAHNRIELQKKFLDDNPDIALVGSQLLFIDTTGKSLGKSHYPTSMTEIRNFLPIQNCIAHPAVMYRSRVIKSLGGYTPFFEGAEDYELWSRVISKYPVVNLNEYLTCYRFSGSQYSKSLGVKGRILAEIIRLKSASPNMFDSVFFSKSYSTSEEEELLRDLQSCLRHQGADTLVNREQLLSDCFYLFGKKDFRSRIHFIVKFTNLFVRFPKIASRIFKYNMLAKTRLFFNRN